MKKKIFVIKIVFEIFRCFPHLLLLTFHRNKQLIVSDVKRWLKIFGLNYSTFTGFLYLLSFYPEYRNVFYARVGFWKHILNVICPRMSTLYIVTDDIGKALFIQHGFATIIAAKSIGDDCWINQQVTIGYADDTDMPVIGNNVTINAGAKVIGKVTVGDHAKVGANAVVVKNVPNDCTVVGVPAYIIKRNNIRVNEKL